MSVKSDNALERIATALEGIESSLSDMQQPLEALEELSECVAKTQRGSLFCITGNVNTRDY